MDELISWVINLIKGHYTWIFSGIGCLMITGLIAVFIKKPSSNSLNIKGNHNISLQGSTNNKININHPEKEDEKK